MKILYHHRTLSDGAEGIHIKEMVNAFRSLGHTVKVIGPVGESSSVSTNRFHLLQKLKLGTPAILYEILEIAYTGISFFYLLREIFRFKPDFIYDRYITFNAGTVLASKVMGVPLFLEVNSPLSLERGVEPDEKLTFRTISLFIEKWVCSHSTRTIVVSTPLKDYLKSIGVPANKCLIMPNGANPERFSPRPKNFTLLSDLGIPKNNFVIGFTGIMRTWHGLDLLLSAVAKIKKAGANISLLIVGDGPYRRKLVENIKEFGLEGTVYITGIIPHGLVPEYISLFDVAVSPMATFYASPMKVLEYMALGKPVIVPATPNFIDIIDDGINGLTFKDGNTHSLESRLKLLLESPELCNSIGYEARLKIVNRLNWQWNAEHVCHLI